MDLSISKLEPDTQGKDGSTSRKAENQATSNSRRECMAHEFILQETKTPGVREKKTIHIGIRTLSNSLVNEGLGTKLVPAKDDSNACPDSKAYLRGSKT